MFWTMPPPFCYVNSPLENLSYLFISFEISTMKQVASLPSSVGTNSEIPCPKLEMDQRLS